MNICSMENEADVLSSSTTTSPVSVTQEEENPSNSLSVTESTGQTVQRPILQKPKPKSAEHSIEMDKLSLLSAGPEHTISI